MAGNLSSKWEHLLIDRWTLTLYFCIFNASIFFVFVVLFSIVQFYLQFYNKTAWFLGEFIDFVHIDDARNIDNVRETIRFYSRM